MSGHQRTSSRGEALKTPHSVSLKVLRLSKPSLSYQYPLAHTPSSSDLHIAPQAALSYPPPTSSSSPDTNQFILTPLLTLPPAFGSAYVGETFACTLCANNELQDKAEGRSISAVRIAAEMQTPSQPTGQPLDLSDGQGNDAHGRDLEPGDSLQKIVRFELKDEGTHCLSVTVTYTETTRLAGVADEGKGVAGGARVRTFRKLYQFIAQQLLSVRTKAGDLAGARGTGRSRYALEAQLENMGERAVSLEAVTVNPKPSFDVVSLNWDVDGSSDGSQHCPILNPKDIIQVAFLLEQKEGVPEEELPPSTSKAFLTAKRVVLGQLSIQWQSAMGDRGSLSTGWLSSKKR